MSGFNPFGFGGGFGFGGPGSSVETYKKKLRPYTQRPNISGLKSEANYGNKIYLPHKILEDLVRLNIEYPMLFRITNTRTGEYSHAGVLEFTSEMGRVWLPEWMMEKLQIRERDMVEIMNVTLPKCKFTKLEPQSVDFLEITDTRAVLEKAMTNYSTLTKGDVIPFKYAGKEYKIKVLELRPQDAVSIIETDMETDFAPPVGYVEPERWEPTRIRKQYESVIKTRASTNSADGRPTTPRRQGVTLNPKRRARSNLLGTATTSPTPATSANESGTSGHVPNPEAIAPFELPLGHLFFGFDLPSPPSPGIDEAGEDVKGKDRGDQGSGRSLGRLRRGVVLGSANTASAATNKNSSSGSSNSNSNKPRRGGTLGSS